MTPDRRNYFTVWFIASATMALLSTAFFAAADRWPSIGGRNGVNLAIALPIIGGIAILLPIMIKSLRR